MKTYDNFDELAKSGNHEILINSDLLNFTSLYKGFGIECKIGALRTNIQTRMYVEGEEEIHYKIILCGQTRCKIEKQSTIDKKFEGLCGVYSSIYFDKSGKFIKQGFWE